MWYILKLWYQKIINIYNLERTVHWHKLINLNQNRLFYLCAQNGLWIETKLGVQALFCYTQNTVTPPPHPRYLWKAWKLITQLLNGLLDNLQCVLSTYCNIETFFHALTAYHFWLFCHLLWVCMGYMIMNCFPEGFVGWQILSNYSWNYIT